MVSDPTEKGAVILGYGLGKVEGVKVSTALPFKMYFVYSKAGEGW